MIAEVQAEETWHTAFQQGVASWRTLRTQHAIRLFCERLSSELAGPQPFLAVYKDLSHDQAAAYQVYSVPYRLDRAHAQDVGLPESGVVLGRLLWW